MSAPRPSRVAIAAAAVAFLLSGCSGAQQPGINPGVAARVGDQTITLDEVNQQSDEICQAVKDDLSDPLPMSLARYQILTGQIGRAIADQIAASYDVKPGADYANAVAAAKTQVATYPEHLQDTLVEVSTSQDYVQSILDAASRKALADEGVSDPTEDEVTDRSQDLFATWPDDNRLEIDPRFGFTLDEGAFVQDETGLSYAVSDIAKAGQKSQPDAAVTAQLPSSQRCG